MDPKHNALMLSDGAEFPASRDYWQASSPICVGGGVLFVATMPQAPSSGRPMSFTPLTTWNKFHVAAFSAPEEAGLQTPPCPAGSKAASRIDAVFLHTRVVECCPKNPGWQGTVCRMWWLLPHIPCMMIIRQAGKDSARRRRTSNIAEETKLRQAASCQLPGESPPNPGVHGIAGRHTRRGARVARLKLRGLFFPSCFRSGRA